MSEDRTTQNLPNDEFRQILAQLNSINARLDRVGSRLDNMDARLEQLEARDYDTKPIWENALKEIADTRAEMREGFTAVRAEMREGFEQVNARIDKLQAEAQEMRNETTTGMRKMVKQIDVLNHNLLGIEAELRLMDDRLDKLEPQPTQ
jgi:chromosome segregation ATPase